ncbi:MAG TPA: anti-sigma factor [Flavitalea sp.]|nr:anti-sigma factor [Flavitalea sp.]
MNIQEYISSGIIESYVFGLASSEERIEFERLAVEFPELREARNNFELLLEEQLQRNVVTPPPVIKSKLLSSIDLEEPGTAPSFTGGGGSTPPSVTGTGDNQNDEYPIGKAKVGMVVRKDFSKLLAAAAVLLLLMSTALNFYFFNRYREYNDKYQALIATQTDLATHNQILQTRLLEYEKTMEMMKDPAMYIVKMPAIPTSPDPSSATTVYWDTRTKDVYLAVNRLPAPESGKQYQLWAMVDGKPVDAGVFDLKDGAGMTKMKNIQKAEAFAITLEKRGGSPTPSLDKLYVMGKV